MQINFITSKVIGVVSSGCPEVNPDRKSVLSERMVNSHLKTLKWSRRRVSACQLRSQDWIVLLYSNLECV